MQQSLKEKISKFDLLFLSFFGSGFLPKAPGTFGSFFSLPLIILLGYFHLNMIWHLAIIVCLTILASIRTEKIQNNFSLHDPQWIVIDEVIGMIATFVLVPKPYSLVELCLGFALFRFFDIFKFWPASYFDKKVHHGFGTIFDDVISGFYATFVLFIGQSFFLTKLSGQEFKILALP